MSVAAMDPKKFGPNRNHMEITTSTPVRSEERSLGGRLVDLIDEALAADDEVNVAKAAMYVAQSVENEVLRPALQWALWGCVHRRLNDRQRRLQIQAPAAGERRLVRVGTKEAKPLEDLTADELAGIADYYERRAKWAAADAKRFNSLRALLYGDSSGEYPGGDTVGDLDPDVVDEIMRKDQP
jgi:hypothetical protein